MVENKGIGFLHLNMGAGLFVFIAQIHRLLDQVGPGCLDLGLIVEEVEVDLLDLGRNV